MPRTSSAGAVTPAPNCARLADRVADLPWPRITADLDAFGAATTGPLLTPLECREVIRIYADDARFRSTITMARHGFGRGEYRYFADPLPDTVAELRLHLYPRLAGLANRWHEAMRLETRFPATLAEFTHRCHAAGQSRPTPLLLRYREGDHNCLHQDLYGPLVFPLQVAVLLSRPGVDFEGGAFVLTEQRPRMQSRAEVVDLVQGEAVVFAVSQRPVLGAKGVYRVTMRHGVSRIRGGERYTMGVIFHDAA